MPTDSNFSAEPSYHTSPAAGYGASKHGFVHSGAEYSGHHWSYNNHDGHQNSQYRQHGKDNYDEGKNQVKHQV